MEHHEFTGFKITKPNIPTDSRQQQSELQYLYSHATIFQTLNKFSNLNCLSINVVAAVRESVIKENCMSATDHLNSSKPRLG